MLTAIGLDGNTRIAWETERTAAPFFCPECNEPMIIKKGTKKAHHFAHIPPAVCEFGQGETLSHLNIKRAIYMDLLNNPSVTKLALERGLGSVRPDISMYIRGVPVAIEIQRSNISEATIWQRFQEYAKKKIYLMWVLANEPPADNSIVKVRKWHKSLMQKYYDHLYFHAGGSCVAAYHMSRYSRWVEEYEHYELGIVVGGYDYWYEGSRIADLKGTFSIVDNFEAYKRNPWCLLWHHPDHKY